jgi:uroporphyrin-3 C-methyltransferase
MRVLVTRPAAQAADWVARLRSRGIDAAALPLIGIAPAEDTNAITAAWQGLAVLRLVVFVSPNAVEQFFAGRPEGATWPATTRAGSPGPGTTQSLADLGVPAGSIVEPAADSAQFDSEALWAALSAFDWQGAQVLIVRGDGGREWLGDTLRAHGAVVDHVSAYRRVAPAFDAAQRALLADAVERPGQHLWLFSSSEAAEHLAEKGPGADWRAAHAIATHARIAARVRQLGFGQVLETRPAFDAVVACIQSVPTVSELPSAPSNPPLSTAPAGRDAPVRWWLVFAALLAVATAGSVWLAWHADQRVQHLEQELVRRQQESADRSSEARMFAKQAEDEAREAGAKVALLDARVTEVAVQRAQLEELIQSLSRSRDENLLVDIDSAIRVALQQTAITGSAEPLVAALKQSDERLARYDQPRVEGVRRAIARDLDRVKGASVADIGNLSIRLDDVVRMVDDLPLMSGVDRRGDVAAKAPPAMPPATAASVAPAAGAADWSGRWLGEMGAAWNGFSARISSEARSLLRVTRIDHPEAMLLAPDQAFFLKENLKLRLLNARLALLSRQFDTAQADLQTARGVLDRYFDRNARRTVLASDLIKQVAAQARQVNVPRPDDTLAALAAASGGR